MLQFQTTGRLWPLYAVQVERARSWLESRGAGPRPLPPDYIVYVWFSEQPFVFEVSSRTSLNMGIGRYRMV